MKNGTILQEEVVTAKISFRNAFSLEAFQWMIAEMIVGYGMEWEIILFPG